jgi:hypothetical protein
MTLWQPHPAHPERLEQPLQWKDPELVVIDGRGREFKWTNPDPFLGDVFAIMWMAVRHTFVIRARPKDVAFANDGGDRLWHAWFAYRLGLRHTGLVRDGRTEQAEAELGAVIRRQLGPWPLPNVSFYSGHQRGFESYADLILANRPRSSITED